MDPPSPALPPASEPTPHQEALRRIVEVFQSGYQAAETLRSTADALSPSEVRVELEAIERRMLSQIASICMLYELEEGTLLRH